MSSSDATRKLIELGRLAVAVHAADLSDDEWEIAVEEIGRKASAFSADEKQESAPVTQRKVYLRVRISVEHAAEIRAAVDRAGINVSDWMISRLLACARQER